MDLVPADGCTFYTYDSKSELLIPVTTTLLEEYQQRMSYKVPLGEGVTGKAALERRPIMANNVHMDPEAARVPDTEELPTCLLATPLVARGELVGAMTLIRLSEKGFEEHDLQLFTLFGRQAAEVFTNGRLFGQLRELNENLEKIVAERTGELENARRDLEAVHEGYTDRVRTRLATIAPIMEKISIGDFSENIPLPEIEDEFTELFVGLNLMIDDLRFMFEENRRRSEETRRRSEELSTLLDTSTAISSSLYEDEVSQLVAERAISLIKADRCNVYRFDPEINELIPQTTTEIEQRSQIMEFNVPLGYGVVGKAAQERTPQLANNVHKDPAAPRIPETQDRPSCIMAAPLIVQRELLGVMALSRLSEEAFTEHDLELFLLFSRQVAEATANARLFGKLKDLNENLEQIVNQRTNELEESNRKTAAFARELEEVIYVTSHDLKTPLRAISGFSQFLYEDYKDKIGPEGRLYLTRLIDAAKRMERLLDDLLNISAITRKERVFENIPAGELIEETIKIINPSADSEVIYDPKSLPVIFCDRTKLVEVFYNLISNGLKFNDKPRKKVTITARDSEGFHEFTVEDNGIGIEKRHYERIFKIFQRLHLREEYEGTGVGLSMVKRVLEEHNGRIWVESQVGVGTIFHFTLPYHKEDDLGESENLERST
jgi:signal transduction histidine kinase